MNRHEIKINRALGLAARDGHHTGPGTAKAVLSQIPAELYDSLTGAQLSLVYGALRAAHSSGRAAQARDLLAEGAIWTGSRMIEIATKTQPTCEYATYLPQRGGESATLCDAVAIRVTRGDGWSHYRCEEHLVY